MRQGRAFSYEGALPIFLALVLKMGGGGSDGDDDIDDGQQQQTITSVRVSMNFERYAG
jgi:hypothetical protein